MNITDDKIEKVKRYICNTANAILIEKPFPVSKNQNIKKTKKNSIIEQSPIEIVSGQ